MNDDDNNDDLKKKSPFLPTKFDSSPSSHDDEETRATLVGGAAVAPSDSEDWTGTKYEMKNDGGDKTLRARVAATVDNAVSSSLEESGRGS
jgi:hypothetical protein